MASNSLDRTAFWGGVLVLFGLLFLLDNFDILNFDYLFSTFWPLILIAIGVKIILDRKRRSEETEVVTGRVGEGGMKTAGRSPGDRINESNVFGDIRIDSFSGDKISESNVFGDIRIKWTGERFAGGSLNTVFGDIHLDMSAVKIKADRSRLNISGIFGDITLYLPPGTPVRVKASAVAGDLTVINHHREGIFPSLDYSDEGAILIHVDTSIIFGSINIFRQTAADQKSG